MARLGDKSMARYSRYGIKKELAGRLSILKVGLDKVFGPTKLKNISSIPGLIIKAREKVDEFTELLYNGKYDSILSSNEEDQLKANLGEVDLFLTDFEKQFIALGEQMRDCQANIRCLKGILNKLQCKKVKSKKPISRKNVKITKKNVKMLDKKVAEIESLEDIMKIDNLKQWNAVKKGSFADIVKWYREPVGKDVLGE